MRRSTHSEAKTGFDLKKKLKKCSPLNKHHGLYDMPKKFMYSKKKKGRYSDELAFTPGKCWLYSSERAHALET